MFMLRGYRPKRSNHYISSRPMVDQDESWRCLIVANSDRTPDYLRDRPCVAPPGSSLFGSYCAGPNSSAITAAAAAAAVAVAMAIETAVSKKARMSASWRGPRSIDTGNTSSVQPRSLSIESSPDAEQVDFMRRLPPLRLGVHR
jgi:hypothetical protein